MFPQFLEIVFEIESWSSPDFPSVRAYQSKEASVLMIFSIIKPLFELNTHNVSMAEPEVHFVGTKRSAASAGIDPLRRT